MVRQCKLFIWCLLCDVQADSNELQHALKHHSQYKLKEVKDVNLLSLEGTINNIIQNSQFRSNCDIVAIIASCKAKIFEKQGIEWFETLDEFFQRFVSYRPPEGV